MMLPQERVLSVLQDPPEGGIYVFAGPDDPIALTLRSLAAEQGAAFFSYQKPHQFTGDDTDVEDAAAVCYIGLGDSHPSVYTSALQRTIRSLALVMHRNCCQHAFFVFDKTWKSSAGWHGKGGRAVPVLISNGYKIQHAAETTQDVTILQKGELLSSFKQATQLATA